MLKYSLSDLLLNEIFLKSEYLLQNYSSLNPKFIFNVFSTFSNMLR